LGFGQQIMTSPNIASFDAHFRASVSGI
jgi:hypothetical protein